MQKPSLRLTPRFIAVIHVNNLFQAINQTRLAIENGADGVFLINHDVWKISWSALNSIYFRLHQQFRNTWIGLNYLDLRPIEARRVIPINADALWSDSLAPTPPLSNGKRRFGGVAFKGQPHVQDLFKAAQSAIQHTDVVTTSGDKTGSPPTLEKVQIIRDAIGPEKLLAIASGMDANNVSQFAPFIDYALVATGISKSFHEFDPAKIQEFRNAISSS
jgi:uncharacterized protein